MPEPRRKRRRRWGRTLGLALLIVLFGLLVPLVRAAIECQILADVPPVQRQLPPETADLPGYQRSQDQGYLTVPEWYIVFNADEYAAFIADNPPSQFPYFRAIGQFWQSYYDVCGVVGGEYPFNGSYQMILAIIGTSFTVENGLRGSYEKTIGRLAETLSSGEPTEEELYARQVAKAYGDFIHTIPWFRFPFSEKFWGLWQETSLWGPDPIRKWERKMALSIEYGGKALYAALLRGGADATFAPIDQETMLRASGITEAVLAAEPELRVVKPLSDGLVIAAVPRYEGFTQIIPRLAQQGVRFSDIAAIDEILITIIAPETWTYDLDSGEVIFTQEILSRPDHNRIAINVPVTDLHTVLNELTAQGIELEHIYDY
ncbi:MAG: hypothetical protein R3264_18750 [Anaerolineae bacterium]|nr:hypothetical protein [Anaerolineae bacterium]